MKKLVALLLSAAMILSLAACGGTTATTTTASEEASSAATAEASSATSTDSGKQFKIGILQYATHASLDDCYNGIVEGLKDAGYVDGENCTIDYQNGQGESETNDLIASNFVSSGYDLIIAIATPSAMSAYAAAKEAGIPVIFSAVSDPVGAGLVSSLDDPETGCTGTSDSLNYEAQLKLIRAFQPDAKKIGILYTTSETNSTAQLAGYEAVAGNYGFEIVSQGITNASEVASGAAYLVSAGVDCINNLTDNTVVNNFSVVTAATDPAGIPCYGSEIDQVAQYGCIASESLDYVALGKTTGKMAADVLGGADVNTMAVSVVSDTTPCYSSTNLKKFDLTVPGDYSSATDVSAS